MLTTTAWALNMILAIAPVSESAKKFQMPEEDVYAYYESIADDLGTAVDASEPLFSGEQGVRKTAALVLSLAYYESSGFMPSIDDGSLRGDSGTSWCFMQIHIGKGKVPVGSAEVQSWSGKDLVEDRYKCFAAGIAILRDAQYRCGADKNGRWLSAYTAGVCKDESKARARWGYASWLAARDS